MIGEIDGQRSNVKNQTRTRVTKQDQSNMVSVLKQVEWKPSNDKYKPKLFKPLAGVKSARCINMEREAIASNRLKLKKDPLIKQDFILGNGSSMMRSPIRNQGKENETDVSNSDTPVRQTPRRKNNLPKGPKQSANRKVVLKNKFEKTNSATTQ